MQLCATFEGRYSFLRGVNVKGLKHPAGNPRCGSPKLLEAEHRTKAELDRPVILLDQLFTITDKQVAGKIGISEITSRSTEATS